MFQTLVKSKLHTRGPFAERERKETQGDDWTTKKRE